MIFLINHTTKEIRRVSHHFSKSISISLWESLHAFRWEKTHVIEMVNTQQRGTWSALRDYIVYRCYDAEKEFFPEDWFAFETVATK